MSTPFPPPSEDEIAALHQAFDKSASVVADRLRRTAAEVERHAAQIHRDLRDLKPDYTSSACDIVSDIQSLMGNLRLSDLVDAAGDVDRAVRR